MILPVIGFPFRWPASTQGTIDSRAQYIAILFRCNDVIILQFDWTFLVLGNRAPGQVFELGAPDGVGVKIVPPVINVPPPPPDSIH